MIVTYLIAMLIILGLLSGWVGVQHLSRSFNARHPELSLTTEEETACGMFCFCKNGNKCPRKKSPVPKKDNLPIH
ncbi:chemotaxis protein [Puniceicoccales bacterium CK1056]|uniref:Chemotaxis protein n=1 Tax=Oceanipulchritudo coccoides TaxID=2706888 RepID=A0A6B2M375_9BACT|nr:chemotaxis protein [Oceanipulchritudo coccoides]NDV62150.1 chemotaxis protein [Oceanipulchritudo coccoides]